MKTIPIALQSHYEGKARTLAIGLKFTLTDGAELAFTNHDRDIEVSSVTYTASPKAQLESLISTGGFQVDNTEVETLLDDDGITFADLQSGRWDGAEWELIRFNWKSTADGFEIVKGGRIGNVTQKSSRFQVELRGESQDIQQTVGGITTPTCQWRLGSTARPAGLCGIDLGPFTVTGAFTGVTSRYIAADSGRAEAAEWFTEAELTITSGANDGRRRKVKAFASGQFTFSLPFAFDIDVGDTYSVHAGCRKRFLEDCVAKFSNGRRFGGHPHLPGVDKITRPPEV